MERSKIVVANFRAPFELTRCFYSDPEHFKQVMDRIKCIGVVFMAPW